MRRAECVSLLVLGSWLHTYKPSFTAAVTAHTACYGGLADVSSYPSRDQISVAT